MTAAHETEKRGVYQFPCGAEIVGYIDSTVRLSSKNRVRLVVFGSEGAQRPKNEGVEAPCLYDCPTSKHRKATRGFIENSSTPITLVTCLSTWRFGT